MTNTEKRKHIRFDAINPSEVSIYNNDVLVKEERGKTINISKGGALIETDFPIEKGQRVALVITIDTDFVYISGKVAHSRMENDTTCKAGVAFLTVDETGKQILEQYISIFKKSKNN
jgi:c-di-GMP-binding flagellar brake protein YcgR